MKKVLGSTLALAVLLWAMTVPWQDPAMNVWWWRNQLMLLTGVAAWALWADTLHRVAVWCGVAS